MLIDFGLETLHSLPCVVQRVAIEIDQSQSWRRRRKPAFIQELPRPNTHVQVIRRHNVCRNAEEDSLLDTPTRGGWKVPAQAGRKPEGHALNTPLARRLLPFP